MHVSDSSHQNNVKTKFLGLQLNEIFVKDFHLKKKNKKKHQQQQQPLKKKYEAKGPQI